MQAYSSLAESQLTKEEQLSILRSKKEKLMSKVWNVLTVTISVPPIPDDKFCWEYVDKSGTGWCLYYMSFTADTRSFSKDVGRDTEGLL